MGIFYSWSDGHRAFEKLVELCQIVEFTLMLCQSFSSDGEASGEVAFNLISGFFCCIKLL